MDYSKVRVLVMNGGSRQILGVLPGLKRLGCRVSTVSNSKLDNGYVSRYPDEKLLVPKAQQNPEGLYRFILDTVKTGRYDVLLVLSDPGMDMITRHIDELSAFVRLPIPDRETFLKAYDKQRTLDACMDGGIPCPVTKRQDEDLKAFLKKVGFPLIAKPRMAYGSMGLKKVRDRAHLDRLLAEGTVRLEDYVLQEFIPQTGRQYNLHLVADGKGSVPVSLVTEKVRWFPVDGGASCLCRTASQPQARADCERLLKRIGWRSYCEIELIEDPRDGVCKLMEINGRASASIKIMQLAGMNVGKLLLELACGEPLDTYPDPEEDIRMRCLITDTLWFLKSPERFTKKPSYFSPFRTKDVIFSWADPLPAFTFVLSSLPKYSKAMKKRDRN